MLHLGDITKISGCSAPVVDCIIGGSPCQDLSVAGKRAGLDGERSGLYMEQIRIVKEMREQDERHGRTGVDIRPRYMVWENVPGAFSSNKGEDFRIVLEELAKVKDKDAVIPMPQSGKWTNYGCIVGDGWSIAWRILDAQFWGVPQRRRRIALVADFGGQSAPKILFVRKSVSGDIEPSEPQRKATSSDASRGIGADDREGASYGFPLGFRPENVRCYEEKGTTLCNGTRPGFTTGVIQPVFSVENHPNDSRVGINKDGKVQALTSRMGTGGGNVPMVMQQCFSKSKRAQSATDNETWVESDTANTLNAFDVGDVRTTEAVVYALDRASFNQGKNASYDFEVSDKGVNSPLVARGPGAVAYAIDQQGGKGGANFAENVMPTLCSDSHGTPHAVAYQAYPEVGDGVVGTLDAHHSNFPGCRGGMERTMVAQAVDCRNGTENSVNGALQSNSAHSLNGNNVVRTRYIVRRLTPLECERLQGYPDGWTDIGEWTDSNGKKRQTSDAARYKCLGNSISLPNWKWVLKRICACYERDATMASLFDGIGGFPYLWEQLNGKGTCLWASEIEEFPIAVTKVRIGE